MSVEKQEQELTQALKKHKLVVVLRADTITAALEKAEALIDSGIRFLEVTFTIPDAEQVIKKLSERGDSLVGAGTVISAQQAEAAIAAGAKFLVSPGYQSEISSIAKQASIAYIPGVLTPSEIMAALHGGHRLLKLFPARDPTI